MQRDFCHVAIFKALPNTFWLQQSPAERGSSTDRFSNCSKHISWLQQELFFNFWVFKYSHSINNRDFRMCCPQTVSYFLAFLTCHTEKYLINCLYKCPMVCIMLKIVVYKYCLLMEHFYLLQYSIAVKEGINYF